MEKRPGADLVYAINMLGSNFGDIDFTASNEEQEAKRLFSVKAMSDIDLLFLQKEDLFELDMEFKKEVMNLFA